MLPKYIGISHMLQWLYMYVASVCFKYFICFFQTYVASIFIWMLCMLLTYCHAFQVFLGVFINVSYACFKCFIFLQTHVAKVSSGCLYILQCDSSATAACSSCWGTVHAYEEWRDGALCGCGRGKRRRRAVAVASGRASGR
jgi:hypothetical protein